MAASLFLSAWAILIAVFALGFYVGERMGCQRGVEREYEFLDRYRPWM